MQVAEGQRLEQRQRLLEFSVGFAGKAHHHVRAQGQRRTGSAHQRGNLFCVVPGPVAPMHSPQNRIRARLQGQVSVARQARAAELRHEGDQLRVPVHGLDRAEPQPGQRRPRADLPH